MAVRWQIPFRSLRSETLYTVNVYDNGYTGEPVQLVGGADPFVTEEDNDDDWFAPVRTQSGYLSIVDTGKDVAGNPFNWRDFIPTTDTDRPVTLTDERGTIHWQGFMQAQNFGAQLYETPQERQFPVQCVLTALSSKDVPVMTGAENFAYLLTKVVTEIPTLSIDRVLIHGGETAQDWLQKCIDCQLFFDEDEDGALVAQYNLLELLKEVCIYWGWTARTHGQTLYLMRMDDDVLSTNLVLTIDELRTMGNTANKEGSIDGERRTVEIGDDFPNTNNSDIQMRGPSKVVVTANVGEADSAIVKAFPENVMNELYDTGFVHGFVGYFNYSEEINSFESAFLTGLCEKNSSFAVVCERKEDNDGIRNDRNYSYEYHPIIRIKRVADGDVFASLETTFSNVFTRGEFTIRGTIVKERQIYEETVDSTNVGSKSMGMCIGIGVRRLGAKWWDGNKWSSIKTVFNATIGNSGDIMYSVISGGGITQAHKKISIEDEILYGKVFIDFLGSKNIDNDESKCVFDIMDFSLEYERTQNINRPYYASSGRRSSFDYKAKNDNVVNEEWSASTIFATDNYSKYGFGLVRNPDLSFYAEGRSDNKPEQNLADRVAAYWAKSRRKIECELRTDRVEQSAPITPRDLLTIDGTTLYPIAISHDWRNDVMKVTAMEQDQHQHIS